MATSGANTHNHSESDASVGTFMTSAGNFEAKLAEITKSVNTLAVTGWDGKAAGEWGPIQQQWNKSTDEMIAVLRHAANVLGGTGENIRGADAF